MPEVLASAARSRSRSRSISHGRSSRRVVVASREGGRREAGSKQAGRKARLAEAGESLASCYLVSTPVRVVLVVCFVAVGVRGVFFVLLLRAGVVVFAVAAGRCFSLFFAVLLFLLLLQGVVFSINCCCRVFAFFLLLLLQWGVFFAVAAFLLLLRGGVLCFCCRWLFAVVVCLVESCCGVVFF